MNKRYIEDVLPLAELNRYAQKGGGNAMHPYFARRPLTASRAMTLESILGTRGESGAAGESLDGDTSAGEEAGGQAVGVVRGRRIR